MLTAVPRPTYAEVKNHSSRQNLIGSAAVSNLSSAGAKFVRETTHPLKAQFTFHHRT